MKDVLTYKEFIGSAHFDAEDKVLYGKIEGINDLITFEGQYGRRAYRGLPSGGRRLPGSL